MAAMPARCAAVPCPLWLTELSMINRVRARAGSAAMVSGQLEAVHPGHLIVEDGQRIRAALRMRRPQAESAAVPSATHSICMPQAVSCASRIGPVDRMVVDDQDAHAPQFAKREQRRPRGRHPVPSRTVNQKVLPLPGCAVDADRAAHERRRAAGDGQTQARAAVRRAWSSWSACEKGLEQAPACVRRDADAACP